MRISDWSSDVCSSDLLFHYFIYRQLIEKSGNGGLKADKGRHIIRMDTPEHRLHGDFISPVTQHLCHRLTAEFDSGFGKVKNEVVIVTNLENIQHYLIKLNFNLQLPGYLILSNFNPDF